MTPEHCLWARPPQSGSKPSTLTHSSLCHWTPVPSSLCPPPIGSSTPLRLLSVSDPTSIQHPNSDPARLTLISLLTTPPLLATPHHHAHPSTSSPRRPIPPICTPSLFSLSPSICKTASLLPAPSVSLFLAFLSHTPGQNLSHGRIQLAIISTPTLVC